MKISKEAFLRAWQNQKLVRGALKSAHVRLDYTNYEDFLLEGIIVYAEMLTKLTGMKQIEVDRLSFRKIIWHTIDLLRKDKQVAELEVPAEISGQIEQLNNWDNQLILAQELAEMSQLERMLFFNHLIEGQTISALAQQTGISRVQLQRLKHNLLAHLREVLEK